MTRICAVQDDRLIDFADGVEFDLDFDEHVAGCDECQAFVAELWEGELGRDLVALLHHRQTRRAAVVSQFEAAAGGMRHQPSPRPQYR